MIVYVFVCVCSSYNSKSWRVHATEIVPVQHSNVLTAYWQRIPIIITILQRCYKCLWSAPRAHGIQCDNKPENLHTDPTRNICMASARTNYWHARRFCNSAVASHTADCETHSAFVTMRDNFLSFVSRIMKEPRYDFLLDQHAIRYIFVYKCESTIQYEEAYTGFRNKSSTEINSYSMLRLI